MQQMSQQTRKELITALRERYAGATKLEKGRMLDEFTALSGYHRKHAVRLLTTTNKGGDLEVATSSLYTVEVR